MIFVKDITYPKASSLTPAACERVMNAAAVDAGSYVRMGTVLLQVKEGVQLWVSKEVSDDLIHSEIDPADIKFEDVEWPHNRMEVFFEDKQIPTFLATMFTNEGQRQAMERLLKRPVDFSEDDRELRARELEEPLIHVQAMDHQEAMISLTYLPEDVDSFASGESMPPASHPHEGWSTDMSHSEEDELRRLTVLFFKVLLFAGSEGHNVRHTMDKPTKKQGGKPGWRNRPKTARLIVEYLPRHRTSKRKAHAAVHADKGHKFKGRCGHFRVYKHERYKEMRNKRVFIYPIPAPDGSPPPRKIFKVVK